MVTVLAATMLLGQQELPNGGALISKVMERYRGAQSVSGTIESEIKSGPTTVRIKTVLQYDRPNRFYFNQTKTVTGPVEAGMPNKFRTATVVSDGLQVMYDSPDAGKRMLGQKAFEPAFFLDGSGKDIDYLCVVARGVMLERSICLDFLTAELGALEEIANLKIKTCTTTGTTTVDGKSAYVLEGEMAEYPLKGNYRMLVDAEGNLYGMSTQFAVSGQTDTGKPVPRTTVTMTQKVTSMVNQANDQARYTIPKKN